MEVKVLDLVLRPQLYHCLLYHLQPPPAAIDSSTDAPPQLLLPSRSPIISHSASSNLPRLSFIKTQPNPFKNCIKNCLMRQQAQGEADEWNIDNLSMYTGSKVSPDWICAVTSRFTKLFYCERLNIAHI